MPFAYDGLTRSGGYEAGNRNGRGVGTGVLAMISASPLSFPVVRALGGRAGAGHPVARRRAADPSRASGVAGVLFAAFVLLAVAAGWRLRDSTPLTPESGPGYALGVCGGVTTLVLALFPVRKRVRFMRRWGVLGHWFRVHMILGALARC